MFADYGLSFEWEPGERLPAPTADHVSHAEVGGKPLQKRVHPRGGSAVSVEAELAEPSADAALPVVLGKKRPIADPSLLVVNHRDFEDGSMIVYEDDDAPFWGVGEVVAVDHASPFVEIHRYGSRSYRLGKPLAKCRWAPAFFDPRDGQQVYTSKPLRRYEPIFDIVSFEKIVRRDFYLTNAGVLPQGVRRAVESRPAYHGDDD